MDQNKLSITDGAKPWRYELDAFIRDKWVQRLFTGAILINAILTGVETYLEEGTQASIAVGRMQYACLGVFLVEIALKLVCYRFDFFKVGWNIFDLIVVLPALLPFVPTEATVLRVFRLLRVLRLLHKFKELRVTTEVLLRSLRSIAWIGLLMVICFYAYGVIGVLLFGDTQVEYATLHEAMFSLFRSLTCEDWTDLRYAAMEDHGYLLPTLYHCSWVLICTFLLINLVIGAVVGHYEDMRKNGK